MNQRRFLVFVAVLFFLCAVPFLLVRASGMASAGLSAGFSAPLEQVTHLVLFLMVGVWASLLPREGLLLVPLSCLFMVLVGAALMLGSQQHHAMVQFLLGGVLCFGILCGLTRYKLTLLSVLFAGSFGFHMGMHYLGSVPSIASTLYYLLGIMLSVALILAIAVAFGVTLLGDHEQFWLKFRDSERFRFVRDFLK